MRAIAGGAATYRVQLHSGFDFDAAAAVVPYLAELGVTHLYCSPYLQAVTGSSHGYDVVDHGRLNQELGGTAGYRRLVAGLAEAGLGQLVDIVPNHMAVDGRANTWWWDVLENGPSSPYATYFDIDWDPPERKLIATVLMPVLGDHYGRVLDAGEIRVEYHQGSFTVRYFDHEAPVSPRSLDDVISRAAARAGSDQLAELAAELGRLPHALLTDSDAVEQRHRNKETLLDGVARLCAARPEVGAALVAEIEAVNQDPDLLDALLQRQNYRLAYWRTAAEELSYRRFFNIETLVGLRMEDDRVFRATHRLVLDRVAEGSVDGLRVDHIDGLADPERYLDRLAGASGGAYVVVEKILEQGEELASSWSTAGTTGYDFLNAASRLFVDLDGEEVMRQAYARFTGQDDTYLDVVHLSKLQIVRHELAAELERLTGILADVCDDHRHYRDYTRRELRDALGEMIAGFPVYRPYTSPGRPVSPADHQGIVTAVRRAKMRRPDLDGDLLNFVGDLVALAYPGLQESAFAVRFAQLSAPVMAKGVEDTAFYRYYPLSSLNEVGGSPGDLGDPVADFHRIMVKGRPETMLTLSTHDTKRSGDVRARINVLSELGEAWGDAVIRWADANDRYKQGGWPDHNAEYLLYQTLVGAWPIEGDRAAAYMHKAMREARVHTSWVDPDDTYESALQAFVRSVLGDDHFVADVSDFMAAHRLVERGRINSLAQTTLLLTCPGVADLYQGSEVWDLSLVDPDNRRAVDYENRRRLLHCLMEAGPEAALEQTEQGGPKLWLIHRLLRHRQNSPACYGAESSYLPLPVEGPEATRIVAFSRSGGLVVVVPRLLGGLAVTGWGGTTVILPEGEWIDVLSEARFVGGAAGVEELFRRFPVAVLGRQD
jgi:(1->4)-alpha-D-glucan 1-alpha-D-glucosylmutase